MAKHSWKRAAALLLAGGLLLSQGTTAFAAPAGETEETVTAVTAPDGTGEWMEVSEDVLALIGDGTVYQDGETGCLIRTEDGAWIHPVTGEVIPEEGAEGTESTAPETGDAQTEDTGPETGGDTAGTDEADDSTGDPENGSADEPTGDPADGSAGEPAEEAAEGSGETEESPDRTADSAADRDETQEDGTGDARSEEEGGGEDGSGESSAGSREELIENAQIVESPVIVEDFRFWTVARKYAFAKADLYIREEIPEEDGAADDMEDGGGSGGGTPGTAAALSEASGEALETYGVISLSGGITEGKLSGGLLSLTEGVRPVGYLKEGGLAYILKEEEDGWLYVESGAVRGFVRAEELYTDEDAQEILADYQETAKENAEALGQEYTGIGNTAPVAEALVNASENSAYTYLRATVNQTVIEAEYAIAKEDLSIREGKSGDSKEVGSLEEGGLCYLIADQADDWIYVESGDVRGFVEADALDFGGEVTEQVEGAGEESFAEAEQTVEPEENAALYYTLTSVKSGVPGGEVRESLLTFASQFIGNPYVWGGTSLTEGADCSGFVQSIYKEYGYELPRVAADQAYAGTQIAVEDAQPGDLVFYADETGSIYHVVIYAGEGKTIEAQSSRTGIVQGTLDTADAVWAVQILEDSTYSYLSGDISEVNASEEMYGENLGSFTITYYCACEICCDVETGITATGTPVVEGRTIAVDPSVIPYGTQVIIGGHVFTAEDCGGAVKGNHIDIYVNDHQTALSLGRGQADVYLVK